MQYRYTSQNVIKTFAHKSLQVFFNGGSKAGIQPAHAAGICRQLALLDQSAGSQDMNLPGWKLHPLKGELAGWLLVGLGERQLAADLPIRGWRRDLGRLPRLPLNKER